MMDSFCSFFVCYFLYINCSGLLMSALHINYEAMHAEINSSHCCELVKIQNHFENKTGEKNRDRIEITREHGKQ